MIVKYSKGGVNTPDYTIISTFCFTCRPKFFVGKRILKQLTATLRPAVSKRWVHVDAVPVVVRV